MSEILSIEVEKFGAEFESGERTELEARDYLWEKLPPRIAVLEADNTILPKQVERLPEVKISDGDVWLIFADAMISIESICNSRAPGPIVRRNLRAWRDKALVTEEEA